MQWPQRAGERGSDGLDISEFRVALGEILGEKMDSRISTMFMKIDIESGGKVDWVRYHQATTTIFEVDNISNNNMITTIMIDKYGDFKNKDVCHSADSLIHHAVCDKRSAIWLSMAQWYIRSLIIFPWASREFTSVILIVGLMLLPTNFAPSFLTWLHQYVTICLCAHTLPYNVALGDKKSV